MVSTNVGNLNTTCHSRMFDEYKYVYPVLSRRAGGLSVGINMNPDKRCNYSCLYCEVNRNVSGNLCKFDIETCHSELSRMLGSLKSEEHEVRDVAFSGEGEPTSSSEIADCIEMAGRELKHAGFHEAKVTIITNGTYLHKKWMEPALASLNRHNGEIWVKLDAGTQEYMSRVNGTAFSIEKLTENIALTGRRMGVVIQSLFMNIRDVPPSENEVEAYIARLKRLLERGTQIEQVQVYTVARTPAEVYVTPLDRNILNLLATKIKAETNLEAVLY